MNPRSRRGLEATRISQVEPAHYFSGAYNGKARFVSYWYQINQILLLQPRTVLEVGVGNSLVSRYLGSAGIKTTTLDIDPRLHPQVVGSILALPFGSGSFELVACYELLEHLPFGDVPRALAEVHRVSGRHAVLSLPDCTHSFRVSLQVPGFREWRTLVGLPRMFARRRREPQHCWVIGEAGVPLRRLLCEIENAGFDLITSYRAFENPYHRFFVLTVRGRRSS